MRLGKLRWPGNLTPMASTEISAEPARPLAHIAHGLMMGVADSVPGISGGTIAFVVGIYDKLLDSIGQGFRAIISLIRFDLAGVKRHLGLVQWKLIIPLFAGIGTALVIAAGIVPDLLERYPSQARAVFLGMVGASIAVPWSRMSERTVSHLGMAVVSAVAAFVLSGLPPGTVADPTMTQVFLTAMIAICAMILPGVSGAFLLLVFGMYEPTLEAVHDRNLGYVATFAGGAVLGLGSFSIVLGAALRRFHDTTMAILIGLMVGSLRALWPWQTDDRELLGPDNGSSLTTALALALAGFGIVWAIERFGSKKALDTLPTAH
jgi:putative membrane protein